MPNKHIRVYELAKELNKTSKEIMAVLAEKNIEVTTHMATLEDNQAELVRGAVGSGQQEAEKRRSSSGKEEKIRSGTQSGEQQRQEESGASSADSEKRSKTCGKTGSGKTGSGKAGNSTSWSNSVRRDNGSTCSINSSTETRRCSSTCSKTCKTGS